ncbi:MAG: sigma-70 family RNA polymerase sigma factor [Alphaproteobacteria bacterium]
MTFLLKKLPESLIPIAEKCKETSILSDNQYNLLIKNWAHKKCEKSRQDLILAFFPLVHSLSIKKYSNNKEIKFEDIFSAGVEGLIKSIDKYEIKDDSRLSSYAIWWIKSSISEYIKNNWSQVKICTSKSQRILFSNYSKIKKDLKILNKENLNEQDLNNISKVTKLNIKKIEEFQIRFQKDHYVGESKDFNNLPVNEDFVNDNNVENIFFKNEKNIFQKKSITKALKNLSKKERYIIQKRFLSEDKQNREKIGKFFKISDERVRQIENEAKSKILNFFKENNIEKDLKNYL